MNILTVFIIIITTVAICMIMFQGYYIYNNYENIKEFNALHSSLEYTNTLNTLSIDRTVIDPNDDVYDVKQKWRCVKFNNDYVSISAFGFKSDGKKIRKFNNIDDCIYYTFSISNNTNIINPCIYPNDPKSKECIFLKSAL
ncbi:MV entry-fusion complex protein [Cotia virus SPAn232]|uniref:MV entry-fusion complex protein n=2 Tax=Cotia virus TaxID=39444 RepID=A0A097IVZ5_9POXV|nr:MV entry-fusion complex protein [Cotia virus SPAn232]ADT91145.1 MV entry-fusion complex protein [Cotia virus SPAn232]AIT70750.1 MV entry-fusion complex protein [Cotia virus]